MSVEAHCVLCDGISCLVYDRVLDAFIHRTLQFCEWSLANRVLPPSEGC